MNDVTDVFPVILEELRGTTTKTKAADGIGISRVALGYYESGERRPDIEVLSKIAKYYDVSTDYLLGLTKVKKPDIEVRAIAEKTGLSQQAIDTIRGYKEDDPDLLIGLNFLIEDDDFKEALSRLDDYKYDLMRSRLPLIEYTKAIASGEPPEESLITGLDQAADRVHASEYYTVKAFQKLIDSWTDSNAKEIEKLSPEELHDQVLEHGKKIRLG